MEQTIVDFFSKSSELILTSRLRASKTHEQANSQIANSNPLKFQLNVPQKFNFNEKIPPQWNSQHNKLLVIEFFLRFNSSKEKVLLEQWSFELNEVSDTKIKFTIDSQNTLYKKLSVLLRTISLLTVTLPLYKGFVNEKSSSLWESCTLEHSINFTRHNLSNWHPRVYEEKNYTNYTNPDFVLPGRTFSFKVAYAKSIGFVQSISDESITPKSNNQLNLLKHKLDMDYFGKKMRERVASEDISGIAFQSTRKSTSDSVKATISANHLSPRDPYSFGNEAISETTSPFGSLLTSSPIETQKSPTLKSESRPRRSSGGFYPWDLNKASGGRPRFATIDSEKSGEYEMYIYEDAEFTEVLSGNEVSMRDESPSKFSAHPKGSGDEQDFAVTSRKLSMQDLKLSGNVKPIEKIIEHSDDDKIADIMKVVDELKDHYADLFGSQKMAPKRAQENKKNINNVQKGLKFQSMQENDKNMTTLASDFELLGNLYAQLKR